MGDLIFLTLSTVPCCQERDGLQIKIWMKFEWTWKVEISQIKFVGRWSMLSYILTYSRLKIDNHWHRWAPSQRNLNFCVHSVGCEGRRLCVLPTASRPAAAKSYCRCAAWTEPAVSTVHVSCSHHWVHWGPCHMCTTNFINILKNIKWGNSVDWLSQKRRT